LKKSEVDPVQFQKFRVCNELNWYYKLKEWGNFDCSANKPALAPKIIKSETSSMRKVKTPFPCGWTWHTVLACHKSDAKKMLPIIDKLIIQ